MAFSAFFDLAVFVLLKATGTERDCMIKLNSRADLCRFADDHAGAVVDKKMRTDFCTRMNIDPSPAVCPLGHDARNQGHLIVKQVRHSMNGDGFQRGISK